MWRTAYCSRILLGFVLSLGLACKKKQVATPTEAPAEQPAATGTGPSSSPAPAVNQAPPKLPGASDVRAALARGDYSMAVESYLALKEVAYTDSQWIDEYRRLNAELLTKLNQAAPKDPKAAQALGMLRAAILGR
jgi:hypothetical protein